MLNYILALLLLILSSPLWVVFYCLVKLTSKGEFIFRQNRVGINKTEFTLYKIRTMVWNAEDLKRKLKESNEANGPVFKIKNDPRYTKVGKFLSRTGLDELPQLINVLKGDMFLVGPRPLPPEEVKTIPKKYGDRFCVKPGITSPWVVSGYHAIDFDKWMQLDLKYIKNKSFLFDMRILIKTFFLVLQMITSFVRSRF